jgi:hypothetical protein
MQPVSVDDAEADEMARLRAAFPASGSGARMRAAGCGTSPAASSPSPAAFPSARRICTFRACRSSVLMARASAARRAVRLPVLAAGARLRESQRV